MSETVLHIGDRMRFSGELLTNIQVGDPEVVVVVIDIREGADGLKTVVLRVDE